MSSSLKRRTSKSKLHKLDLNSIANPKKEPEVRWKPQKAINRLEGTSDSREMEGKKKSKTKQILEK